MRRATSLLAATMLALLLLACGGALAQTTPRGTLDADNLSAQSNAEASIQRSSVRMVRQAQTFTAENTGKLTGAEVSVRKESAASGPLTVELTSLDSSGSPAAVLAATTVTASEFDTVTGGPLVTADFAVPADVVAGERYALVLSVVADDSFYAWSLVNDTYLGGQNLFDAGGGWTAGASSLDTIFAIYVDTAPPLARNDSFSVREDARLSVRPPGVLKNDFDPHGDRLTANLVSKPKHGKLVLRADGSFAYEPRRNYNGADSFAYRASDGGGATSEVVKVTIRVTPVPEPNAKKSRSNQNQNQSQSSGR